MDKDKPQNEHPLVIFMPSGLRGRIPAGTTLLDAARQVGVEIESICGGQLTCGKCKIRIETGTFPKHGIRSEERHVSPTSPEEAELLKAERAQGCRLACSTTLLGDVLVTIPEESQTRKQIIRKSATERPIEVQPAIRQVYVTVEEPKLEDPQGDWERLQKALSVQWGLQSLRMDVSALQNLPEVLRQGHWSVTVILWQQGEVIAVYPGFREGIHGLAVDIGTTTLAAYLCDLRTGELLATEAMMNPQVTYGEDLMSRVSYAMTHLDGLEKMHTNIIHAINELAKRAVEQAGLQTQDIHEAVLVGNTVMHHILLGIDPNQLGKAPFALVTHDPLDIKARDLGLRLNMGANAHILPLIAGHVGADNVGVLLAEEPHAQDEMVLIFDIGTNGEILLGNRNRVLSASSPTGPAFEGAQITHGMRAAPGAIERVRIPPQTKEPRLKIISDDHWSDEAAFPPRSVAGICGSGIIEAVAELFMAGILLPDGRFNPDCQHPRLLQGDQGRAYVLANAEQTKSGQPVVITQKDVRAIQLAKAALHAGAKLLMKRANIHTADKIILAGAFGSYISPKHAMVLGLIPDCPLDKVFAVGNAAGDGARIALLNRQKRLEAKEIARWVEYVETAVEPTFQDEFVAALNLPHSRDPYPHIQVCLSEQRDCAGAHADESDHVTRKSSDGK
ncbi:MAG: ASKHA domain-containing protein [Chloroflexota bacterium]